MSIYDVCSLQLIKRFFRTNIEFILILCYLNVKIVTTFQTLQVEDAVFFISW
jgi:hypothetical protein